jgi:hypothetical protein
MQAESSNILGLDVISILKRFDLGFLDSVSNVHNIS